MKQFFIRYKRTRTHRSTSSFYFFRMEYNCVILVCIYSLPVYMKKLSLLSLLASLFLLTSCQAAPVTNLNRNINSVPSSSANINQNALSANANHSAGNQNAAEPASVTDFESQPVAEVAKIERNDTAPKILATTTKIYSGAWFDVQYPADFTPRPTAPLQDGSDTVDTDEAFFAAPDNSVEFFAYSPLWGGDPIDYLTARPNEKMVSEKTDEKGQNENKQTTRWVTFQAVDGSYMRSYVSSKYQDGQLHHVFGIQYKDAAAYDRYKSAYAAFKNSLVQYAD